MSFPTPSASPPTTTMSSTAPHIPDKTLLIDGLFSLLATISSTISKNFDIAAPSTEDLLAAVSILSEFIIAYCARNMRRSRSPLDPADLAFYVLRTRNPKETTIDDAGKKVKGEKDWYYLILAEAAEGTGEGQTLAEGRLRKDKSELFDGFMEAVEEKVERWNEQDSW